MKIKNILLSIVLALSLPNKSEAITSYTANVLTTISGSLGAIFGAAVVKGERGSNTDAVMGATIFGGGAAGLAYMLFHSFTPESRLKEAQAINRRVGNDPLVLTPEETQNDYVTAVERQRVRSKFPVLDAWKDLCGLDDKVKTSRSLLNDAFCDAVNGTRLYNDITTEQDTTEFLGARITNRLFFLKKVPAFMKQMKAADRFKLERKRIAVEQDKADQFARQAAAQEEANRIAMLKLSK